MPLLPHTPEIDSFLSAIHADSSNASKLVFADWLDERDDPRGELLRLSCAHAAEEHNSPQRDDLETRLAAWRQKWMKPWLGPLEGGVNLDGGLLLLFVDDKRPFAHWRKAIGPELRGWVGHVQWWNGGDRALSEVAAWPWLPSLSLPGGAGPTDLGSADLPQVTGLRRLFLGGCHMTAQGLEPLTRLAHLRVLGLGSVTSSFIDGLPHLAEMPALEVLTLGFPWPRRDYFAPVGRLTRLHALSLGGNGVTDETLVYLGGLSALRQLNLSGCKELTGAGLADLAGLPILRSLDLSNCWQVKNADLAPLVRCATLERVSVECCTRLTDKALEHLGKLTELRELNVSECPQIRGKGLRALAGLRRLEHLKLSGSKDLTDESLLPLKGLEELRILRLRNCPKLSAGGLIAALGALSQLRWLDLRECRQLSEADRSRLRQTWPGCQITF